MEVEKTGNCLLATISTLACTSQADILTGIGQLRESTELLKRRLAISASHLLAEDSPVRRKLLHVCNSSSEELVEYIGPYLDSLKTGAPDNQLWCHGLENDKVTCKAAPSHLKEQVVPPFSHEHPNQTEPRRHYHNVTVKLSPEKLASLS